ncbi:MAG: hypothetical protein ACREGA_02325 [Candidatus Saccharimonadales bacterium]
MGLIESAPEVDGLEALYARPAFGENPVESIRSASYEAQVQRNFADWLGEIGLKGAAETSEPKRQDTETNLLGNLRRARNGSPEALNMIKANVATAVAEACFKKDHITKILTLANEAGELMQFGQTMTNVHKNALTMRPNRHPILREITKLEALNGQRIQTALAAGDLDDYYFVVPSIVPDNVPEAELGYKGDGYFLSGLTFVVQATTRQKNGEVTTESAFIEGVENGETKTFNQRLASRHDIQALAKIYDYFGLESPQTAAEFLNNGLKIPKSLMPNGMADFMRWCDQAKDDIFGRQITRNPQDYIKIIYESRRREASLLGTRQKVLDELLESAYDLNEPMQAVKQMWKIIKNFAVEASFKNNYIDPLVFGAEAAGHIHQIRNFIADGQEHMARESMEKAQKTAVAGGCGGGSEDDESGGTFGKNPGSNSSNNENYKFDKKMYCVVCQALPKSNEAKKWCGPCGLCRPCDNRISKKSKNS